MLPPQVRFHSFLGFPAHIPIVAAPTAAPAAPFSLFGPPKTDEKKDAPAPAPAGGLFGGQIASKDAPKPAAGPGMLMYIMRHH